MRNHCPPEMMKNDGKTSAGKRKKRQNTWHLEQYNLSKSFLLSEKELVQLNKIQMERGYKCNHDQCGFRSFRKTEFDRHIQKAHEPKEIVKIKKLKIKKLKIKELKIKECPLCDFKTSSPNAFDMHLKIHVGEKSFQVDNKFRWTVLFLITNKSIRTTMRLKWAFWDILGHLGTIRNNSEDFLTSLDHLDCFPSHFRPFFTIIGSFNKMRDGPMDERTNGWTDRPSYRDAWTHLKRWGLSPVVYLI